MTGGTLDNSLGYIGTLYYGGGTIVYGGDIGEIIYLDGADAGMDGAEFDNADFDEGYVADPIIVLDNADWDAGDGQDAAPLGEEAMVW